MVRYSIRNPSGAVVIDFISLTAVDGYLGVMLPDGTRTKVLDSQALYLCDHGWTLHVTYGSTSHQLSSGSLVIRRMKRANKSEPVTRLRSDASWRGGWGAETVALEFAHFQRPDDVAKRLGVTREAIYTHLKRLSKKFIVERRKIGFVEFRVTGKPVPNYDPQAGRKQPNADTPRTTYAELQERLKKDGLLPDVVAV